MKINPINPQTNQLTNNTFKAKFKTNWDYTHINEDIIECGYENEFKGLLNYLKKIKTKTPLTILSRQGWLSSEKGHTMTVAGGQTKEPVELKWISDCNFKNPLEPLYQLFDAKSEGFKELFGERYDLESPESIVQQPSSIFDKYVKPCKFCNGQRQYYYQKVSDEYSLLGYLSEVAQCKTGSSRIPWFDIDISAFETTPFELTKFLYKCTSDSNFAPMIVQEILQNNDYQNTKKTLVDMIGEENFNTWLNDEQFGYKKAYTDFYNKKFDESKSLMDLVKISPNIAPWAFKDKANVLCHEPTLGEVPAGFRNLTEFRDFMTLLKNISKTDEVLRQSTKKISSLKNIEHNISINGKNFKVEKLNGGMSAKTKYMVTPENEETYIVKFNENDFRGNSWRTTQILENQALRADSPYLNAMVDFYLKANNCPMAPDVKFYDMKTQATVYQMTKGTPAEKIKNVKFNNLYLMNNSKMMKDFSKLGIVLNDINAENFIKDSSGKLILIDSGHAKFSHPFRPMVPGKHISLNNICGREI